MKKIIETLFPQLALHYKAYKRLIKNERSYLYLSGWMKSIKESSLIDKNGRQIPWMNYCVIQFLKHKLKKDFILFEFGSGYSTRFYADRVSAVISVE